MSKIENGGPASARDAEVIDALIAALRDCARHPRKAQRNAIVAKADAMLAERNRRAEPAPAGDVESAIKQFAALALKKVVNAARHVADKGRLDQFSRAHLRGQLAGLSLVAMDADAVGAANAELDALIDKVDEVAE